MPRMNIKRTCKNRFLRCPTSEISLCGFGHTSGREPNVKNRVSVMQRLGMGDHPGVLARSVWRLKSLVARSAERSEARSADYSGQTGRQWDPVRLSVCGDLSHILVDTIIWDPLGPDPHAICRQNMSPFPAPAGPCF